MFSVLCMNLATSENNTEDITSITGDSSDQTQYSLALHLLFPIAGLILVLFRQKKFLDKLLFRLDKNCISVLCPSLSKRHNVLKWATNRLPPTWSSKSKTLSGGIAELWCDGSILCTLINSAIPGVCPNPYRHWKKPITHAQSMAYKYFGIIPIFTESELSGALTTDLESAFIDYLNELQMAITRQTENRGLISTISEEYLPRGMGLFSGEQNRRSVFYVYLSKKISESVIIQIRGPYNSYGEAIIPKLDSEYRENKPKSQGIKYFTIPFMDNNNKPLGEKIPVDITLEADRAMVSYLPKNYGMYEINMIVNGELLRGCPYNVHVFKNLSMEVEQEAATNTTAKRNRKTKIISQKIYLDGEIVELKNLSEDTNVNLKEVLDKLLAKIDKDEPDMGVLIEEVTKSTTEGILGTITEIDEKSGDINEEKDLRETQPLVSEEENVTIVHKDNSINGISLYEIREKFEELGIKESNPKLLKDIINDSNKKEHELFTKNMENDCEIKHDTFETLHTPTREVKDFKNISRQLQSCLNNAPQNSIKTINNNYVDSKLNPEAKPSVDDETSSICPDHIAHEVVEYKQMSVAEKRKIFSQRTLSSTNSSFSSTENAEVFRSQRHLKSGGLSVLDVISTLKQSQSTDGPLNSAVSLPNISTESDYVFPKLVTEKKTFWESFSQCTNLKSGNVPRPRSSMGKFSKVQPDVIPQSSAEAPKSLPNMSFVSEDVFVNLVKQKKNFWENITSESTTSSTNRLNDHERSRRIWKKPGALEQPREDMYKSADDILSMTDSPRGLRNSKQYKSMDTSLNECAVLSIAERKRILLEKSYSKDRKEVKRIKRKTPDAVELNDNKNEESKLIHETTSTSRSPIAEKISKYITASNSDLSKEITKPVTIPKNLNKSPLTSSPNLTVSPLREKLEVKSHFRRAIKYFKNLEQKSLNKTKDQSQVKNVARKLDRPLKRGGSLNLSTVSKRFSITNLYKDVFGSTKNGFRGAPNRSALVEALATFPRRENTSFKPGSDENDIRFEIFKKSKIKKRKSLKSVFDLYY